MHGSGERRLPVEKLTAFFDLILPRSGWKCLFVMPDKRHHWFQDHATMAEAALLLDQEGKTVYHGNAGFAGKSRKADNAQTLQSFRLDVDGGAGKPYSGPGDCFGAVQKWLADTGLPPPLVVGSGGGLHLYWPLRDQLDRGQWERAAHRLQSLCAAHGLVVDTTTTCDAARILRPPFTHNRKAEPVQVRLGPLVGPYSLEELGPLFEGEDDEQLVLPPVRQPSATQRLGVPVRADDGLTNIRAVEPDPDPDAIARECAQVRRLRDNHGRVAEPDWYAVLGVLAHCGPSGSQCAHTWSAGDVRYSPGAAAEKLEHARTAAGPTTCNRFRDLNPAGCQSCPHQGRITSPIQLGRGALPASTTSPGPVSSEGRLELPLLPDPYFWKGTRLAVKDQSKKEDAPPYHIVADYPFLIDELQEGERSKGVSAVCKTWEPMHGTWREFPLLLKEAVGDRGLGALAHHSVVIDKKRWPHMASYLSAMANHHKGSKRYGIRYEQFGWKTVDGQPAFVVGTELLGRQATARCFGSPELERRAALFQPQGTLAAWCEAAEHTTRTPGMEAHTFVALCGFASILYHLTGAEGGTIVHGTTMDSGKGKTFGLKIAASIWGELAGMRIKERDTEVAKFIAIGMLGHLPVLYDELRATGADAADRIKGFVLQYTLGEDKARGAADGGLKADNLPWSNIMLSTANISLIDTCLSDGAETAQAARVFEFSPSLPAGVTTSYGDDLERQMAANRGQAGRAFVQACLGRWEWLRQAVPDAVKLWETRLGGGPDLRYTLRLLGAVTVAMAVVQQAGILTVNEPALMAWMDATARDNAARLAVEREPDPVGILSRMINDLLPNTLVMPGPVPKGTAVNARYEALREPRGELLARQEVEGRAYIVEITAVKRWMQEHKYPMTEIGRTLEALGVVKDRRCRRTLSAGWRRSMGQPWCWLVDGTHPAVAELWVETESAATVTPENVLLFPAQGGK